MHPYTSSKRRAYLQRSPRRPSGLPSSARASPGAAVCCCPSKSTRRSGDSSAQSGPTSCPPHSRFFQFVMDTSKIKRKVLPSFAQGIKKYELPLTVKTSNKKHGSIFLSYWTNKVSFLIFVFLKKWLFSIPNEINAVKNSQWSLKHIPTFDPIIPILELCIQNIYHNKEL